MRPALPMVALVVIALLACKGGSKTSSTSDASATGSSEGADEGPIGKLGAVSPAELEARAKKAGYSVKSTDEENDFGMVVRSVELEEDEHFAYLTLVDLGAGEGPAHAAKMGVDAGLVVHFDAAAKGATAPKLRDQLLAAKPLDELSRNNLKDTLESVGWKQVTATSDTEDGITTTSLAAEKGSAEATFVLVDFRSAKKEGRIAVDANRLLNVFVCQDCTKRKEGVLADMKHRRLARKLLGKLTSP